MEDGEDHVFVVMNSVFPAEASQFLSERFDLKGSTVGRECSEEERLEKGSSAILKDLDLAREVELVKRFEPKSKSFGIHIGPTAKAALLSQLRRDVKFLVHCQVMDYSLLVGVVRMTPNSMDVASLEAWEQSEWQEARFSALAASGQPSEKKNSKRRGIDRLAAIFLPPIRIISAPVLYAGRRLWSGADSTVSTVLTRPLPYYGAQQTGVDGGSLSLVQGKRNGKQALYYMGVIDFLQPWTRRKVLERQLKGIVGYDVHAISCVPPEEYAARFLEFLEEHIS
uniref:PIPK domain-containing protein n=1 Tax=Grammatophora oceanica TaxID=210454 RepID=A0A7S1VWQ4_9STRA